MPVSLPIVLEITSHPGVAHLPKQRPVFVDLLKSWLHKKGARRRS